MSATQTQKTWTFVLITSKTSRAQQNITWKSPNKKKKPQQQRSRIVALVGLFRVCRTHTTVGHVAQQSMTAQQQHQAEHGKISDRVEHVHFEPVQYVEADNGTDRAMENDSHQIKWHEFEVDADDSPENEEH